MVIRPEDVKLRAPVSQPRPPGNTGVRAPEARYDSSAATSGNSGRWYGAFGPSHSTHVTSRSHAGNEVRSVHTNQEV